MPKSQPRIHFTKINRELIAGRITIAESKELWQQWGRLTRGWRGRRPGKTYPFDGKEISERLYAFLMNEGCKCWGDVLHNIYSSTKWKRHLQEVMELYLILEEMTANDNIPAKDRRDVA